MAGSSVRWPLTRSHTIEKAARFATRGRLASSVAGRASAANRAAWSAFGWRSPRRCHVMPRADTKGQTTSRTIVTTLACSAMAPPSSRRRSAGLRLAGLGIDADVLEVEVGLGLQPRLVHTDAGAGAGADVHPDVDAEPAGYE